MGDGIKFGKMMGGESGWTNESRALMMPGDGTGKQAW